MTDEKARELARMRWGENGDIDRMGKIKMVGVIRFGILEPKGSGPTWAHAFADADLRSKKRKLAKERKDGHSKPAKTLSQLVDAAKTPEVKKIFVIKVKKPKGWNDPTRIHPVYEEPTPKPSPGLARVRAIHGWPQGGGNMHTTFWFPVDQRPVFVHGLKVYRDAYCKQTFKILATEEGIDVKTIPGWGLAWIRRVAQNLGITIHEECSDCGVTFRPASVMDCTWRCPACFKIYGWRPSRRAEAHLREVRAAIKESRT